MKYIDCNFFIRCMSHVCNGFIIMLVLVCCACHNDDSNKLSRLSPLEHFELMVEDIFIQDDVTALSHLMDATKPRPLPKILPYTHQTLWNLAIGHKAEKCIRLLLSVHPFDCECTTYLSLKGIAFLDSKELRVALLEALKENIFVKKMEIEEGEVVYYTFLENYTGRKKAYWYQCLGEYRYREYLEELTDASEKIIKNEVKK